MGRPRRSTKPTELDVAIQVHRDGTVQPPNAERVSVSTRLWPCAHSHLSFVLGSTFASSAPSVAVQSIATSLHTSTEVSYFVTSVFLLGFAFGPICWGPASEFTGRRPMFVGTFFIYTMFHLGQTLAKNMETLLVTRFLCGFFACAPLTCGGGLIADIWGPVGRGPATSMYTCMVFLGPVIGPIVGGL
jgi:MFS transporter, DHA1 family, multidrug resistance protein